MTALRIETMRPGFEKIHLGDGRVLHWITTPDGEEFHDHPFDIQAEVLRGGYIEERLGTASNYRSSRGREIDDEFFIQAACRHRITEVSPGGCLTLCTYGPHERETRFYRVTPDGVQSRAWHQTWDEALAATEPRP